MTTADDPTPGADSPVPRHERPRFLFAIAFGVATLIGFLFALQSVVTTVGNGNPPNVSWALQSQMSAWYSWLIVLPGLWWAFHRLEIHDRGFGTAFLLHLALGLLAGLSHIVVVSAVWSALGIWERPFQSLVRRLLVTQTFTSYVTYALIAVSYHMLAYVRRLRLEQEAVRIRDEQLSRARLRALQNQLHPHFLFNALNTVSSSLRTGDPLRGARLVSILGDLLRHVLARSRTPETTVAEEIEFLDLYLELLRSRFGDRIAFDRVVDPDAFGARVPTLILQPLVENAIRHGSASTPGPGRVVVRVLRSGDSLRLEVEDDGPGPPSRPSSNGIGLAGTRERVRELYGGAASVDLRGAPGGGAIAVVVLPFRASGPGDGPGRGDGDAIGA